MSELDLLQNDLNQVYKGSIRVYTSVACDGLDIHDEDGTFIETLTDTQEVRYTYGV